VYVNGSWPGEVLGRQHQRRTGPRNNRIHKCAAPQFHCFSVCVAVTVHDTIVYADSKSNAVVNAVLIVISNIKSNFKPYIIVIAHANNDANTNAITNPHNDTNVHTLTNADENTHVHTLLVPNVISNAQSNSHTDTLYFYHAHCVRVLFSCHHFVAISQRDGGS
jgi:hypothetical protein